jgi:hypothetical protein
MAPVLETTTDLRMAQPNRCYVSELVEMAATTSVVNPNVCFRAEAKFASMADIGRKAVVLLDDP